MALPGYVYAQASPLSIGGVSMFNAGTRITRRSVAAFSSEPAVIWAALARLRQAGFDVLHVTPTAINFGGPPELFEKTFRTKIVEKEVEVRPGVTSTYLDSPDTDQLGLISTAGTPYADAIEGIALEVPRILMAESPVAPRPGYWHLDVPLGVATAALATPAYSYGITGQGVRVAMVDSGWYRHAYFQAMGYNVAPVLLAPGASGPDDDESGHGTGESANILAIAPGCELLPVKMSFVNTVAAFDAAVALKPDIITCSWGSNSPFVLSAADMVLAASVAAAVARGITVIFSAGNGHAGFPGQHPDVISAGGTFMDADGSLSASNYSSAFSSQIYPGREVPDVCGLVGMRPKAIYIMLPVQPGDEIDVGNAAAGVAFPDGDETAPDDGWAAFSGTSAAAPQLAGVAALIKQAVPGITPAALKAALMSSARDVVVGTSSPVIPLNIGLAAGFGPDAATGAGLVNAFAAVVTAYLGGGAMSMASAMDVAGDTDAAYLDGMANIAAVINAYANPRVAAEYWSRA
jgi:subtilisin family serine protease